MSTIDLDHFDPRIRIVVIGVGGAGNNAVNRMIEDAIDNVEYYVVNTDSQALASSKAEHRIILGEEVTEGLGAGGDPEIGKQAAEVSIDDIRGAVRGAKLVFIAAGMGGGTGTGAAPVVAKVAREEGALTIAVITRPFGLEGEDRIANAVRGLNELQSAVDSYMVVSNDKLLMLAGNLPPDEALKAADQVLSDSVKTVVDIVIQPAKINRDFADLRSILKGGGMTLIGWAEGHGEHKVEEAVKNALQSPLVEVNISGAKKALLMITTGSQGITFFDSMQAVRLVKDSCDPHVQIKWGTATNPLLGDGIIVAIVASGFPTPDFASTPVVDIPTRESVGNGVPHLQADEAKQDDSDALVSSILPDFLAGN